MNLKTLLKDDDAVSPVIGVILMVAITVILAAVIAAVVTGMGQNTTNAPQASFSFEAGDLDSGSDGPDVKVTHDGGATIDSGNVLVKVDNSTAATHKPGSDLTAGYSWVAVNDASSGDTVTIVWEDSETDKTVTLAEFEI